MTPTELTQYLDALRVAGAMSAEVKLPGGAELRVVFAPEGPPGPHGTPITDELAPGAWKRWAGEEEGDK